MTNEETGDRPQATGHRRQAMRIGNDIATRFLRLAVTCLKIAECLPRTPAGRHVQGQLVRCSTSGGANYEEARGAESRDDFIHKVGVAAKEVRETAFWLSVIAESTWLVSSIADALDEAHSLSAILAASIRTARLRRDSPPR
jgi:four helix bundle protein